MGAGVGGGGGEWGWEGTAVLLASLFDVRLI